MLSELIGKTVMINGYNLVCVEEVSEDGELCGYDSEGEFFGFFEDEIDAVC